MIFYGEDEAALLDVMSGDKPASHAISRDEIPPQPSLNCTPNQFRSIVTAWWTLAHIGVTAPDLPRERVDVLYERITGKRPAW